MLRKFILWSLFIIPRLPIVLLGFLSAWLYIGFMQGIEIFKGIGDYLDA